MGTKAIDKEVKQKVPYLISQGGYIPSLDHCVPPNVSLKNYKFYLNLIREIAESSDSK